MLKIFKDMLVISLKINKKKKKKRRFDFQWFCCWVNARRVHQSKISESKCYWQDHCPKIYEAKKLIFTQPKKHDAYKYLWWNYSVKNSIILRGKVTRPTIFEMSIIVYTLRSITTEQNGTIYCYFRFLIGML